MISRHGTVRPEPLGKLMRLAHNRTADGTRKVASNNVYHVTRRRITSTWALRVASLALTNTFEVEGWQGSWRIDD